MKFSVLVSLVVGLILGIVVGRATSSLGPASLGKAPQAAAQPPRQAPKSDATVWRVPIDGSPVEGSPEALVTFVDFSDYQCPFCGRANTTVQQLKKDYGSKLRLVMKEFPLTTIHPMAKGAALAAVAAGMQGKYWEMHDKLFANQTALQPAALEGYARDIGLDLARFQADMADPRTAAIIERDTDLAGSLGVTGTPAAFVNGRRLAGGAAPIETFKALIDEELAKAEAMVRAGTPAKDVYARIIEKGEVPSAAKARAADTASAVRKVDAPAESPSFGPKFAKVTIVEWSDFQCPYCSRAAPTVERLRKEYGSDVHFVFRNLPLPMHQNARIAAQAAMAANAQGKFWEMHDQLFANQAALDRASLEHTAEKLGLDMGRFGRDIDGALVQAQIAADMAAATAAGVRATPTLFVNGRPITGAPQWEQFKGEIDAEIAKANKLLSQGVKPENLYGRLVADAQAPAAARN
jgi:protein-disulfide isomerase